MAASWAPNRLEPRIQSRNVEPCTWDSLDDLPGLKRAEEGLQLQHVLREGVGAQRITP